MQRRSHDGKRRDAESAEDRPRQYPPGGRAAVRALPGDRHHQDGQGRDGEELPESGARVVRVGQSRRLLHVVVTAEHRPCLGDQEGDVQDQHGAGGNCPHPRFGRRARRPVRQTWSGVAQVDPDRGGSSDDKTEDNTGAHLGVADVRQHRAQQRLERRVGAGEQGAEHHQEHHCHHCHLEDGSQVLHRTVPCAVGDPAPQPCGGRDEGDDRRDDGGGHLANGPGADNQRPRGQDRDGRADCGQPSGAAPSRDE